MTQKDRSKEKTVLHIKAAQKCRQKLTFNNKTKQTEKKGDQKAKI